MKRSFVLFSALILGALSFSSCSKNLKDDVKEIRNELGMDEPATVSTSFKDNNNVDRTIDQIFKFKGGAAYSNALIKNFDGKYEIRIVRFGDVDWDEYASIEFVYDPATKKVTQKRYYHEWEDFGDYDNEVDIYENETPIPGLTFNVDIKSLDLTNGNISLEVKIDGTKEFSQNNSSRVPNENSAFSSTFKFVGKLKVYERTNQPS